MDKIKVCHIITKLELGGAQINTLYTVSHLDKDKFVPVLITGTGGVQDAEAKEFIGVKIFFSSLIIRPIRPWVDFLAFLKIWRILIKERPAIVHTHSSKAGIIGRWAAYFAGIKLIVHTVHGFGFNEFQNPLVRKILILAEKITAKITSKLVVVTNEDIKKGIENGIGETSQYVLIRSGIDTELYKNFSINKEAKKRELEISFSKKIIVSVMPFKVQKNPKDLIKAAKIVTDKYPESIFLIAGDGELRGEMERLISSLDLEVKVKLIGWRRDIPEILAISDVFALTSLWEGLPRSILEAMCLKLPVVAYAVDGVKEVVKDGVTGFLVRPFDIENMASQILKLLNDEKSSKALGQKGFESVTEEFDINFMVKKQEALYINIITNKR